MTNHIEIRALRLRLSLAAAAACILLPLGITACSTSGSRVSDGHPQPNAPSSVGTESQQSQHPTGVSSHIVLETDTLVSGASEQGVLVIENDSGQPIPVGCLRIEVQLINPQFPLELHPTPSCPPALLPVGITRLPLTLHASQVVCQVPNGVTGNASYCKAFPPGTYRTDLYPGVNIPAPPPVAVQIVTED